MGIGEICLVICRALPFRVFILPLPSPLGDIDHPHQEGALPFQHRRPCASSITPFLMHLIRFSIRSDELLNQKYGQYGIGARPG